MAMVAPVDMEQVKRELGLSPALGPSSLAVNSKVVESVVPREELYSDLAHKSAGVAERIIQRREELIRLLIGGMRFKECAAYLRVSPATVRTELKSPAFLLRLRQMSESVYLKVDEELANMKTDPVSRINELATEALDNMEELMQSENLSIKLRANQDMLDRNTTTSRTRRLQSDKRVITIDAATLQRAVKATQEIQKFEKVRQVELLSERSDGELSESQAAVEEEELDLCPSLY